MSHPNVSTQKKIHETIDTLSPESMEELVKFLEFLKFKQRAQEKPVNVHLEGLWRDKSFDVTDEDIRALRRQVSDHVLQRVK